MKELELELQKILRNNIELTISELTCFECYSLLHKGSQAKWQRRENSQARQQVLVHIYKLSVFTLSHVYHTPRF